MEGVIFIKKSKKELLNVLLKHPKIIFISNHFFGDEIFMKSIYEYSVKNSIEIGLYYERYLINTEDYYLMCPLNEIQTLVSKYPIRNIMLETPYGIRDYTKSPKLEKYLLQNHWNWTNVILVHQFCQSKKINVLVDISIVFGENSAEDYYVHLRQLINDGKEIFLRYQENIKNISLCFSEIKPKMKKNNSRNNANITSRFISECLSNINYFIKSNSQEFILSLNEFNKEVKFLTENL